MDLRTISEYGSLYFYPRLELRHGSSMYVKAYLDLSLRSLVVFLCVASWGGSWLPWRAVPCLLFACF